jgi:MFS family permease
MGLACGFINPILSAAIVERIPAHMRARVFGVLTAGVLLATPLAGVGGLLVDTIGMVPTLVLVGAVYFAATVSLLIVPSMREMDKPRAEAAVEVTP